MQGRKLEIKTTRVFKDMVKAYEGGARIIINEGGSRSSKTYSTFQFLLKLFIEKKITAIVCRDKLTWLKSTLLTDYKKFIEDNGLPIKPVIDTKRPEQNYNIYGSEIAFFGLDDPQKLHGRSQDVFWINEAMEATKQDFDQLEMRTSLLGILDYNPSNDQHWVFELTKRPDVVLIKSTMLDNPFLPDAIINKIKGYEPTPENEKNGTADQYMWDVYGLGKKARLQGRVFDNWDEIATIPQEAKIVGYGLDFGYTNDPTALVEVRQMDNHLYIKELIYKTGLTNPDIAKEMDRLGINKDHEIYADSSEPKSIEEIYQYGYNILPVTKGQDSVKFGIDAIKQYKMYIESDSVNGINELRKYKWAENKDGRRLNKPVDANNHFCDALRYLVFMRLSKQSNDDIEIKFI